MSKVIEVIIAPNGEIKIETKGFSGPECQEASRFLEEALGKKNAETLTGEFYSAQQSEQQRQQA